MGFEPLEFFERREIRILVVEVDDEPDGNKIVVVVIKKRTTAGIVGKRPAHRMLHQPLAEILRVDLP